MHQTMVVGGGGYVSSIPGGIPKSQKVHLVSFGRHQNTGLVSQGAFETNPGYTSRPKLDSFRSSLRPFFELHTKIQASH